MNSRPACLPLLPLVGGRAGRVPAAAHARAVRGGVGAGARLMAGLAGRTGPGLDPKATEPHS
jgi:hypothetical protein